MVPIVLHPGFIEEDQLDPLLDVLTGIGFAGIEGISTLFETYRKQTELLHERLRPGKISLIALTGSGDWVIPEQRKELVEQHRPLVEFLRDMNAQYLILETGTREIYEDIRRDFKAAAETLNDLGKLCLDYDLYACIQPRRGQRVETEEEIDRMMNEIDTGAITLCPDTGELLLAEIDPARIIKIYGSCVRHIHCSDPSRAEDLEAKRERGETADEEYAPVGQGQVNFADIAEALRVVDYAGWITARMPLSGEDGDAKYGKILRKSKDLLGEIFQRENAT